MEEKAKSILKKYKQEHIIKYMDSLNKEDRNNIVKQILSIDFEEVKELYDKAKSKVEKKDIKIEPIKSLIKNKLGKEEKENLIKLGEQPLKDNKFAVVTMAGGQGTRLRT